MNDVFYEVTENFSAKQMFDLVNDIAAYPQFVPDCTDAGVLQKTGDLMMAYIEVDKLGFKKRFSTRNRLVEGQSIQVELIDGPFSHLLGEWSFKPLTEKTCLISFHLTFKFKNKLFDVMFSTIFKELMVNMAKAFSERAKQIYQ